MSKTEQAIAWMENTARDDSHGYDQRYRWGEKGDYDCSSAVITAWQSAGVPVKTNGATYTGNMEQAFLRSGFEDVTGSVDLATGSGMQRGDVLLNVVHHTAMYCGNGKLVQASINERGGAIGGVPGDQTGREFYIRSYYNYPWNCVLRYKETVKSNQQPTLSSNIIVPRLDLEIYTLNRGRQGKQIGRTEACVFDDAVTGVSIGVSSGRIEYRVHCIGRGWYGKIYKCDFGGSDCYAGDKRSMIDGLQIYYYTNTRETGGMYYECQYSVKTQKRGWLGTIHDTNWESGDGNHTAGIFGDPVIAVRARLVKC